MFASGVRPTGWMRTRMSPSVRRSPPTARSSSRWQGCFAGSRSPRRVMGSGSGAGVPFNRKRGQRTRESRRVADEMAIGQARAAGSCFLGYSPLATGVRLMVISGGILVTSTVAGRLTSHVPVRLLIGPGLLVIGAGLLLMRGLGAGSAWTHLIPGMIVGSVGVVIAIRRWPPPPSAWCHRSGPAWPRASTRRSARSGSPPASPCWVRCSRTT